MASSCIVKLQYLIPKTALTVLAGKLAHLRAGKLTTAVIRWFVGRYQVNMAEAANPAIESYASFNEFFTRALKPGARPLAQASQICPVDGAISQFGEIKHDQIFQPRAMITPPALYLRAMARWPSNTIMGILPLSTLAPGITIASICHAAASC